MKGSIAFANTALPSLQAGRYNVAVEQSANIAGCAIADCSLRFLVAAEQTAIDPAQVYSCYPPAGAVGAYAECLPHIVLHRRTLPWERNVFADATTANPAETPSPWLALLVFSHDDNVTERDLEYGSAKSAESGVFVPALDRAYGSDTDACRCIDVPAPLFAAVLPDRSALPLTAHTRRVSLDDKVTDASVKDEWFSCIASCRHPREPEEGEEAVRHRAHLVSLEGYGEYLSAADRAAHPIASFAAMRMFSLASWEFWCVRKPFDFRSLARRLTAAPLRDGTATGIPELDALLRLNHSPVPARLREGSRAVSWYRPPLAPQEAGALWSGPEEAEHFADSLLRYDPGIGMFDISLQAAWQLGRLLALQNTDFSRKLLAWRRDNKRDAAANHNNGLLASRANTPLHSLAADLLAACGQIGKDGGLEPAAGEAERKAANEARAAAPAAQTAVSESWFTGAPAENFFRPPARGANSAAGGSGPAERGRELAALLAAYVLLYDIPFCYLVPRESLLPQDSIRFFHLDGRWLRTLMDGAMSLGRNASIDYAHDTAFIRTVYDSVFAECARIRPRLQGKPAPPSVSDAAAGAPSLCTGFLLRSPLVRGWRGLEFKAYAGDGELRALRLETLSREVLLGIYSGGIDRLEILEPPESLHYGFNRAGDRADKTLRRPDTGKLYPDKAIAVPVLPGRVVDFPAAARAIAETLPGAPPPSPALMALEMIQNPYKAVISKETP